MRDTTRLRITEQAKEIRSKLAGATLYGEPVDLDDPDIVLVAAVVMEWTKANHEFAELSDFMLGRR